MSVLPIFGTVLNLLHPQKVLSAATSFHWALSHLFIFTATSVWLVIYVGTFWLFGTFSFCTSTCKNKPSLTHGISLERSYYEISGDYKSISELYLMPKHGTLKPINWVWVATMFPKTWILSWVQGKMFPSKRESR